ncbi:MAG: DNA photolyase family protein [Acidiferrobacterales bacterium]|nr:DNA photolyase family protein [Acidiferrobacterales bacterium]
MKILHWFREDLRLSDNIALSHAAAAGDVLLVYVLPTELGGASKWWLHHSLTSLQSDLAKQNQRLMLLSGDAAEIIPRVAEQCAVDCVTWNRVYSPNGVALGQRVKESLIGLEIDAKSCNSQLLIEPSKLLTKQETPYKVFTPFWRECIRVLDPAECLAEPRINGFKHKLKADLLEDWSLLPNKPNWAEGFADIWQPGEEGAHQRLEQFLDKGIHRYSGGRDIPSEDNTSKLSPHLAFGEIGPRQIWHAVRERLASRQVSSSNGEKFLSEIGWREFSRYLLFHFPHIERKPYAEKFERFPWADDTNLIAAWQRGKTGYPIVDAGMRELWNTGFMHNRVRMIVASFLTKHCLSHWQHGMDWFWDTLLDADIANNTASWQWAAGCGADAAPYFRIFNPITQGEKFDAEGDYLKRWVPELAELPKKFLFKPWEADAATLAQADVRLGENYPFPIVDHKSARELALSSYSSIKS